MQSSPISISLPQRLDRSAAIELKVQLDELIGQNIEIDASNNQSISGAGLQVLHLAESHWTASGWGFDIVQPSQNLTESLGWVGPSNATEFGEI